ncbi:hypothetical protein CPLU01_10060 [Colletotrichum plurivorum]|uniref:Uncharacterized protein n=1 Tax=Colletotrichum plurivorum TaxID=2175906 RepID=A0A8H6K667_9PEZI|nr:hypothetical protein CPLU01_10060 [Colletotrichum plurivorum]
MGSTKEGLRVANYVEFDPDAAPQVALESGPEVVVPMVGLGGGNDGAADSPMQPGEVIAQRPSWRHRLRRHWKFTSLIVALAITAVVLPLCLSLAMKPGQGTVTEDGPSNAPSSTSSTAVSSLSSIASPSPSFAAPGCNSASFRRDVTWIGIFKGSDWEFNLTPAQTAQECCTMCYQWEAPGCNGWLTESCPNGCPDIQFSKDSRQLVGEGGLGPCSGSVRG